MITTSTCPFHLPFPPALLLHPSPPSPSPPPDLPHPLPTNKEKRTMRYPLSTQTLFFLLTALLSAVITFALGPSDASPLQRRMFSTCCFRPTPAHAPPDSGADVDLVLPEIAAEEAMTGLDSRLASSRSKSDSSVPKLTPRTTICILALHPSSRQIYLTRTPHWTLPEGPWLANEPNIAIAYSRVAQSSGIIALTQPKYVVVPVVRAQPEEEGGADEVGAAVTTFYYQVEARLGGGGQGGEWVGYEEAVRRLEGSRPVQGGAVRRVVGWGG